MALSGFNYKISWNKDFSEVDKRRDSSLDAFTSASFKTAKDLKPDAKSSDGLFRFKSSSIDIAIVMNKKESWVHKPSESDNLLKHEQLHYNISALAGRDLERKLKALSDASVKSLFEKAQTLLSDLQKLVDDINKEYDNKIMWGTNHGNIPLHQTVWETHIAKMMNDPNGELKSVYYVMQR